MGHDGDPDGQSNLLRFFCLYNLIISIKRLLKISKNKGVYFRGGYREALSTNPELREALLCNLELSTVLVDRCNFENLCFDEIENYGSLHSVTALWRCPPTPLVQRRIIGLPLRFSHLSVWTKLWTVAIGALPPMARIKVCKMSKHAWKKQTPRRKKRTEALGAHTERE